MDLKFSQFSLKVVEDVKATYTFAAFKNYIDFDVKKIYYVQKYKQSSSQHCHKAEKIVFSMVQGHSTAVIDRGYGKEDISLNSPGGAIYVGTYVWHGFKNFSPDAIMLAISSADDPEDRTDYIEDYDEYRKVIATR
jgi:uncharacterized cupin superfamily protein